MRINTGLLDGDGRDIYDGDFVSLDGNITGDNSMDDLPNGWTFDADDVYEVYFDEDIDNWSLKLGVQPDSSVNIKFMNHAVGLLHGDAVKVVDERRTFCLLPMLLRGQ